MSTDANISDAAHQDEAGPSWRPLGAIERRVLGVLIEKAKTTPENYPLSLSAIRAGANQKSNRAPQMQLDEDHLEEALETLRGVGAVAEVHAEGRVPKYRHLAYKWLGVDKAQMAVMAELLLRGDQTVGELRGRAARMEPIADLAALRPILDALEQQGLIQYLTPRGRGCVLTHALYLPEELAKVRAKYGQGSSSGNEVDSRAGSRSPTPEAMRSVSTPAGATAGQTDHGASSSGAELATLRAEVASLREEVAALRCEVRELQEVERSST